MENIWRCTNKEELRQLQYVACSRTTSDLIIYQRMIILNTNLFKRYCKDEIRYKASNN